MVTDQHTIYKNDFLISLSSQEVKQAWNPPLPCVISSKVCNEPLDSSPERTLLAGLDLRVRHVTSNSKSMGATLPEFALVSWGELAISKKFISLFG